MDICEFFSHAPLSAPVMHLLLHLPTFFNQIYVKCPSDSGGIINFKIGSKNYNRISFQHFQNGVNINYRICHGCLCTCVPVIDMWKTPRHELRNSLQRGIIFAIMLQSADYTCLNVHLVTFSTKMYKIKGFLRFLTISVKSS